MATLTNRICGAMQVLVLSGAAAFGQTVDAREDRAEKAEELLAKLSQPDLRTWAAVEKQIMELWSESGSATADLLLRRGRTALDEEDYPTAVEHLTALTDHAPDFAEGWHTRATAFYMMEEFGLALRDLERALALNPDHFGALTGLGVVLERLGRPHAALRALTRAEALNPHRPDIRSALDRVRAETGAFTL